MTKGQWQVHLPPQLQQDVQQHSADVQLAFSTRAELFSGRQAMQDVYAAYIAAGMQQYEAADESETKRGRRIAACIMEPVIQVLPAIAVCRSARPPAVHSEAQHSCADVSYTQHVV